MARHAQVARSRNFGARQGGFTLVEILVVLAILATLIGLVAAIIPMAMKQRAVTTTQTMIQQIGAALDGLRADRQAFGRFPPTRPDGLRIGKQHVGKQLGVPNRQNVGIETIWFVLNNPLIPGGHAPRVDDSQIGNTDDDRFRAAASNADTAAAYEYLDAWGQPLVYFNAADYKDPKGLAEIKTLDGRVIEVRPKKRSDDAGGGFRGPNSYQLFSVGPDGEQDADDEEDGDDIVWFGN